MLRRRLQEQFRVPVQTSRQAWLDAIGRPNDDPEPFKGLCAEHFVPDDFTVETSRSGKCTANEAAFALSQSL